jgi:hypothetical protein
MVPAVPAVLVILRAQIIAVQKALPVVLVVLAVVRARRIIATLKVLPVALVAVRAVLKATPKVFPAHLTNRASDKAHEH